MSSRNPIRPKRSQHGITLVLISVIMLILIGMGAFAIDLNHQVLNKARLQNAVDSAALASAVVADDAEDASLVVELAETAAIDALKSFAESMGNQELAAEEGMAGDIVVEFSNTKAKGSFLPADEFTPDSDGDIYVRVAVSDISLTQFLSRIFGFGKSVSASAVAGPSAPITRTCNISPIGMCATTASSADLAWGYIPADNSNYDAKTDRDADTVKVLKPPSHKDSGMVAGNFQLLDFGQGKRTVNELLAGYSDACVTVGHDVTTETGVGAGPVAKGVNTRFDGDDPIDTGEKEEDGTPILIEVKPDKYLEESNVTYEDYQTEYKLAENAYEQGEDPGDKALYYADYYESLQSCEGKGIEGGRECKEEYYEEAGEVGRRVLRVPIVNCDTITKNGGKTDIEVLGIGCFFVTQDVDIGNSIIFGQFLENCTVQNASTGIDPGTNKMGPYKIQLYKDPESGES